MMGSWLIRLVLMTYACRIMTIYKGELSIDRYLPILVHHTPTVSGRCYRGQLDRRMQKDHNVLAAL
jgi:hypothetical protein